MPEADYPVPPGRAAHRESSEPFSSAVPIPAEPAGRDADISARRGVRRARRAQKWRLFPTSPPRSSECATLETRREIHVHTQATAEQSACPLGQEPVGTQGACARKD